MNHTGLAAVPNNNPGASTQPSWDEEMRRNLLRMKHLWELALNKNEPEVGITPRELIYSKNKSRLYRYASGRVHKTPILFVPNLGISRPYVFDLMKDASFIWHLTQEQGFDLYLVDWGTFGPEDSDMTFEYAATKILPRFANKALESSGAARISVLSYCMGASLASCFLTTHPDFPVKNFINMAGPIDFSKTGLFTQWMDPRFFDVDKYTGSVGDVPGDAVKLGFKMLRPTTDLSTYVNLWRNAWNPEVVTSYQAMSKWANEYLPFPGAFFNQLAKFFYQENRLMRGGLMMAGREANLMNITCPVLAVGGSEDHIAPPACVQPLIDAVGSKDKEYAEFRAGHISLASSRGAAKHSWPKVSSWLAARS